MRLQDLSPADVARAKRLALHVADTIPSGATADEFRRAGQDQLWQDYDPSKRLLLAIHVIVADRDQLTTS